MKMSDVWNKPLTYGIYDNATVKGQKLPNGLYGMLFSTDEAASAACHAVNNHDRLTSENARLQSKLTTITKQRDELLKCLETVSSHAVYRAGTFNNGETVAQYATRVLSTIKEQKDAE